MGNKQAKIDALLAELGVAGPADSIYYAGYFACFNRQLFYEAHEALEEVWLPVRRSPEGPFYKALIQLAGAFVHLQKGRGAPAARLFRMARENLAPYGAAHRGLDLTAVRALVDDWLVRIEEGGVDLDRAPPRLDWGGVRPG